MIRVPLYLTFVILFLDSYDCTDNRVYEVKVVKNIAEPSTPYDENTFDIDEGNLDGLVNVIKELGEDVCMKICKLAGLEVDKQMKNETVVFHENGEPGAMKPYALDMQSNARFKVILASKCPTIPDIFVQLHNRRKQQQLVTVFVRQSDIQTFVISNKMSYDVKLIDDISLVPVNGIEKYRRKMKHSFDTNNLKEGIRLEMCRKAIDVEMLSQRNFRMMENNAVDLRRMYKLVLKQEDRDYPTEIVFAFRCPIVPTIYLEVRETDDEDGKAFGVRVIIREMDLPPKFDEIKYTYKLKMVRSISQQSTTSIPSQKKSLYSLFEFLRFSKVAKIDPSRFSEMQRLHMCRSAHQQINRERRILKFFNNMRPGKCSHYYMEVDLGQQKEVQAFLCPTNPPVYLSIANQEIDGQNIWVILEKKKSVRVFTTLNIVGHKVKIVEHIETASMDREEDIPQAEEQGDTFDLDDLDTDERQQLCDRATQMVTGVKFRKQATNADETSMFYTLKSEVESQTSVVQAYKCPVEPEMYLHIATRGENEHILWVIMKESKILPIINFVRYQKKPVRDIVPGFRRSSSNVFKYSAINTSKLPKEKLEQMCHIAVQTVSEEEIEILGMDVEIKQKYYSIYEYVESENDGNELSRLKCTIVQACKCPTIPPLYLHVHEDEDEFVIWIFVKESEPTVYIDDFNYDVKIVKNIVYDSSFEPRLHPLSNEMERSTCDTDNFTPAYRRQLCKKAELMISDDNDDVSPKNDMSTAPCLYYNVVVESGRQRVIRAFQCPSEPALYLEMKEIRGEYFVNVFVEYSDLKTEEDEILYLIKYVDTVEKVETKMLGSSKLLKVESDKFKRKKRRRMCRDAWEHRALAGNKIEFSKYGETEFELLYSIVANAGGQTESYEAQAFRCPTRPPIYLQIHFWEEQQHVVWVLIEKEMMRGFREKDPKKSSMPIIEETENLEPPRKLTESIAAMSLSPSRSKESENTKLTEEESSSSSYDKDVPYKIKYVQEIREATEEEILSIPPGPRKSSMIDTDKEYEEYERMLMCHNAAKLVKEEDAVTISDNVETGNNKYYTMIGRSTKNETKGDKLVLRAFECPTKPPLYLAVRFQNVNGVTVRIFLKESDEDDNRMVFTIDTVDKVTEVDEPPNPKSKMSRARTNKFSDEKRYEMCRKAIRIIKKTLKQTVEFPTSNQVGVNKSYSLYIGEHYTITVPAFKCPTRPFIYLEVQSSSIQRTEVRIIMEKHFEPLLQSSPPVNVLEATSRAVSSRVEKLKYYPKPVSNIRKLAIFEGTPSTFDTDDDLQFTDIERTMMCEEAMKVFPNKKFDLEENSRPEISAFYELNTESESQEFITAFKCPTNPEIYIEATEDVTSEGRYKAWVIIVKDGPSLVSKIIDNMLYELQPVNNIVDVNFHLSDTYDISPLLPPRAKYDEEQLEKICENGLQLIPGNESINWVDDQQTRLHKYVISYKMGLQLREELVTACECPTKPSVYLLLYWNETEKMNAVRIILQEIYLPSTS